jgi:hypothetical protein
MTRYICDRCGRTESGPLNVLHKEYQADGIVEICKRCFDAINKELVKANNFYADLIKQRVVDFVTQEAPQ